MSIWKWVGAAVGGVGGFFVGGPAGAVAGAGLGYSAGSSADESNAASDNNATNAAAASNIKVSPSAWAPQPGVLGSSYDGQSDQTKYLQDNVNQATAATAAAKAKLDAMDPSDPNYARAQQAYQTAAQITNNLGNQLDQSQQADKAREGQDATVAVRNMQAAQGRQAPQVSNTLLQRTPVNFGEANATLAGQKDFRGAQLSQADALRAGVGGEGQVALINRLNSDMSGNQPSLAQLQLEEGRDASINNSLAIANSARGNTQGLSQIEALRANERAMQETNRSAAMVRAGEYASARDAMGNVLSQKRGQDLQGQNIAATELGQGRQQDIGVAGIQSQNTLSAAQMAQAEAIQQSNLDDATKRANLQAFFQQQGLNDQMTTYWADKYTHAQERPQDLAIDQQKTQANIASDIYHTTVAQNNSNLDRQQRSDAAVGQGIATFGTGFALNKPSTGGGVSGGTPGTPAPVPQNNYSNPYSVQDPWKQGGA